MQMRCPGCGQVYDFLPEHSESQIQCARCGIVFGVPRIPDVPQQSTAQTPGGSSPQSVRGRPYDSFADPDSFAAASNETVDELPPSRVISRKRTGVNPLPFILGGVGLLLVLLCGGVLTSVVKRSHETAPPEPEYRFAKIDEPVAAFSDEFPERPERWDYWETDGKRFPLLKVKLGVPPGKPGHSDNLWILLPPRMPTEEGAVSPDSQGCVFFTPSNITMCGGMYLDDRDLTECSPYAEAGFLVAAYETDGFIYDAEDSNDLREGFADFKASRAGVINAEYAIQYVLARFPEVDPHRLYAAGHAFSGSMALRLAAHDNRIKGAIAYAPTIDLASYWENVSEREWNETLGDDEAVAFLDHYSPIAQEDRIKCDVFLFHARDDEYVDFLETQEAAERMAPRTDRRLEFHIANVGGHFDAMYDEGLPAGVKFLREIDAAHRR